LRGREENKTTYWRIEMRGKEKEKIGGTGRSALSAPMGCP